MWIRVTDKATGHQYDVLEASFDPAAHKKVNAPKRWPDLPEYERPRTTLYRTDKGDQAPDDDEPSTDDDQVPELDPPTPPDPGGDNPTDAGDPATPKEN